MKVFDKWFNEEPTDLEKGFCMVAWKAALEWVLEELDKEESYEEFHARIHARIKEEVR